ncbi:Putative RNA polymerase II transcriptional coactivator [Cytospora mali]|uniref:RNA polymerase II transcriptional coactivator n=1 Tax=Cytospora mali TaxID=578113 RepID=A0A194WCN3_CYTMA|nr:Putative RNA polymerase II transcriptional coactivator [Valsa mali]
MPVKRLKRSSGFVASDKSDGEEPQVNASKKAKKSSSSSDGKNVDDEGNTFWEYTDGRILTIAPQAADSICQLSNKRRIVVQKFKGNVYVNLREYYEDKKTGAMKPGMKGIMLSVEQYQTLLGTVPDINKELRKNGVNIGDEGAEADVDGGDDGDSDEKPVTSTKKEKKSKKSNFEATSDEAEDDS